jgi:hypothetical protein
MRSPNPPRVYLRGLTEEQQRKVIKVALLVVADLARERDWDAYGHLELAKFDTEETLAFWSLLDSRQRSTIGSLREANDKR